MTTQSTPDALREALVKRVAKYIEHYEDAPSWGGPTMYPRPLDIADIKALHSLALKALSAPPVSREVQQDQGVTAVPAAALAGQEPLSPTVSALRAPPANAWQAAFARLLDCIKIADREWTKIAENGGKHVPALGLSVSSDEAYVAAGVCEALVGKAGRIASAIDAATADETENTGSARKGESAVPDRADAPQTAAGVSKP